MDFTIRDILPDDPTGLKIWKNVRNKFVIVDLHYSANPELRDPKVVEAARAGMPQEEWNREYEKSWETFEGKPVYGADFRESLHVLPEDREADSDLPLMRGWDFGLTPACVIAQKIGRRLYILDEVYAESMGASRFVPAVLEFCNLNFPGHSYFDFVDPAGFNRSESEEKSCVDVMRRPHGLSPVAGELTYEKRLGSVISLLTTMENGRPLFQMNPRCKRLSEGFRGAYHYPDMSKRGVVARMDRPVKNEASHIHDALQYLCSKASSRIVTQPSRSVKIPRVNYSFSSSRE